MSFNDWFRTVIMQYSHKRDGNKVVLGDNLPSHLFPEVPILKECYSNSSRVFPTGSGG